MEYNGLTGYIFDKNNLRSLNNINKLFFRGHLIIIKAHIHMRRILQIVGQLSKNGTETFIMNLFRNIDREKFMFDFLIFTDRKDGFYDEIISLGGKVFSVTSRRNGFFKYHSDLNNFFRAHSKDYSAIHMHLNCLTTVAPFHYAKKFGVPVRIFHSHSISCDGIHNKLFHILNKFRIKSLGTHFFACSEVARNWCYGATPVEKQSQVVPNGIELERFKFNPAIRSQIRKDLNLENAFVIGHVGSFFTVKNHTFMIDIFRHLHDRHPSAKLLLIGEGPLQSEIIDKANRYGLSDDVFFLGRRNNVNELLQAFDVMLMPSLYEGLPFALIEAQAAGVPVVASSSIPSEAKQSSAFEFVSLDEDANVWADTILKFGNHQKSEFSESDLICNYSIAKTVSKFENIYRL